ncbi:MAG: sugar phosphate isomerase/epimerase family protein [Kiritimatiellia bacterium]
MRRRDFLLAGGALALAGCRTAETPAARNADPFGTLSGAATKGPEFHVFSKMFQPPVCKDCEALAELMAKAGFDGIEWTVRPKGHVVPERAKTDLPKAVAAARRQGLKSTMMVTSITDGLRPENLDLLKIAADCGIAQYRPGYYFYDAKTESFRESLARIRAGFASLAKAGEKTGLKAVYQNHSSWGPSVFGGLVWDVHEMIRDLDPRHVGLEYDPMHALFETGRSWSHGLELVADRIGAVCLKDFRYVLSKKEPGQVEKAMCAAGAGVVPWREVRRLLDLNGVKAPYVVHFEYDFGKSDLLKSVKAELDAFRNVFA